MSRSVTHFVISDSTHRRSTSAACGINMEPDVGESPDCTNEPRWVTCKSCQRTNLWKTERAKCPVLVGDPGFKPAK